MKKLLIAAAIAFGISTVGAKAQMTFENYLATAIEMAVAAEICDVNYTREYIVEALTEDAKRMGIPPEALIETVYAGVDDTVAYAEANPEEAEAFCHYAEEVYVF